MENSKSLWLPILIASCVLYALCLLDKCTGVPKPASSIDTMIVERLIVVPPDTVTLVQYRPRIVYRDRFNTDTLSDTVYTTKPFFAYMDTTINCTSVKLRYSFPENTFDSLMFVSCPDSVMIADTTITRTTTLSGSFWDDLQNVGLGFIGGFLVGIGISQ